MSMDDLSYLQALMGMTASEEAAGGAEPAACGSSTWMAAADDAMLRLVGKARVVADALGGYVYLLACGSPAEDAAQRAIHAGADNVLTAAGTPALADLAAFFRERGPQLVLFPRTRRGRTLGPGLAQALGGGLCGYAADLAVDPMSQRVLAHQPVLDDAARQVVAILASPAVVVVDTAALPAAFNEPWRSGNVEDTGLAWPAAPEYPAAELPAAPLTVKNAPVIVAAGLGLVDEAGFALAGKLAEALGGVVAGDTRRAGHGLDHRGSACRADGAQRRAEALPGAGHRRRHQPVHGHAGGRHDRRGPARSRRAVRAGGRLQHHRRSGGVRRRAAGGSGQVA